MKHSLAFSIQSLLEIKNGKVTGPLSPFLFAKETARQMEMKFNRLARVWFDDEQIFQQFEDGGLTGYDSLILACAYKHDLLLSLWVDQGVGGLPVALCYQSDPEVLLTPIYQDSDFARKPTAEEIRQLFDHIFDHPELLAVKGQQQDFSE
jgi:hypothetical protein